MALIDVLVVHLIVQHENIRQLVALNRKINRLIEIIRVQLVIHLHIVGVVCVILVDLALNIGCIVAVLRPDGDHLLLAVRRGAARSGTGRSPAFRAARRVRVAATRKRRHCHSSCQKQGQILILFHFCFPPYRVPLPVQGNPTVFPAPFRTAAGLFLRHRALTMPL